MFKLCDVLRIVTVRKSEEEKKQQQHNKSNIQKSFYGEVCTVMLGIFYVVVCKAAKTYSGIAQNTRVFKCVVICGIKRKA